jgi:TolB-like protein/Tfp pilus assembly protein PilF
VPHGLSRVRACGSSFFSLAPAALQSLNNGPKQGRLSRLYAGRGFGQGDLGMAADKAELNTEIENDELLEGWKAIADHLDKTERTVQRWEKTKGLPVRRLKSGSPEEMSRVFAYKSELNAWWQEKLTKHEYVGDDSNSTLGVRDSRPDLKDSPETNAPDEDISPRALSFRIAAALAVILIAVAVWVFYPKLRPVPAKVTLAVRPFRNLSENPDQDFVAAGFTEEMVTRLGQLHPRAMGVMRLTPAYAKATPERLRKDILADYVLEGSIRRVGDRVAISAQLVQAANQSVIWGDSFDRDVKDLLRVQKEVAEAIAGEVLKKLPHDTSPAREVNREAYLAYLEGRYFWNKRTNESLARALALFQDSISADPTYAPPYAGLADCYELLGSAPYTTLPPNQAFPKAEEAARKALALDASLAEAHVSLGYSEMVYEWRFPEAEKEFARALQLRPDYATAHQFYAYYLTAVGDLDGAIQYRKRALELDPINPLLTSALGEAYYQYRQYDRTIEQNSRSLALDPSYAIGLVNIGRAFELKGMHPQAREAFQKILAVSAENPAVLALMGHEYATSGEPDKARAIVAKLQQISQRTYVPSVYIALVYTGLHDIDHAFQWLDKAYEERCEYLVYLPTEPLADPLRNDPRFAKLLQRIGLRPVPAVTANAN